MNSRTQRFIMAIVVASAMAMASTIASTTKPVQSSGTWTLEQLQDQSRTRTRMPNAASNSRLNAGSDAGISLFDMRLELAEKGEVPSANQEPEFRIEDALGLVSGMVSGDEQGDEQGGVPLYGGRALCASLDVPAAPLQSFKAVIDPISSGPRWNAGSTDSSMFMASNGETIRFTNSSGVLVSELSLDAFFSPLGGSNQQPAIHFDPLTRCWFVVAASMPGSTPSSGVNLAVSAGSDPTGSWSFYHFDTDPGTSHVCEAPQLGCNRSWLAITATVRTQAADFVGVKMWVISKASILTPGGPLEVTAFEPGFDSAGGVRGKVLVPARDVDSSFPELLLIDSPGVTAAGVAQLRLSRITGTPNTPSWSVLPGSLILDSGLFALTTNLSLDVPDAPQLNTTTKIDTGDARITSAIARNGALWAAHAAGFPATSPSRAVCAWYQLLPTLPNPIVQQGVVDTGANTSCFAPSIAPNCGNDAIIAFTNSSITRYLAAMVASRLQSDPPGTMRAPAFVQTGAGPFSSSSAASAVAPATIVVPSWNGDLRSVWTLQQHSLALAGGESRLGLVWSQSARCAVPFFSASTSSSSYCAGVTVVLNVPTFTATAPIVFRWRKDGVVIPNSGGYSGTTTATLAIRNFNSIHAGSYTCLVTSPCGFAVTPAQSLSIGNAAPSAPTSFRAKNSIGSCSRVELSWNSDSAILAADIYRSTTNIFANASLVATSLGSSAEDVVPDPASDYYYWITARNPCGNSAPAGPAQRKGQSIPATPQGLAIGPVVSCFYVGLSWNTVSTASYYEIYRATTSDFSMAKYLWSTASNNYIDTAPIPGQSCYYWVRAYNPCGWSNLGSPSGRYIPANSKITRQPISTPLVYLGTTISFSTTAEGPKPLSYRWYKDGAPLNDVDRISGSNTPTLTIRSIIDTDIGDYACAITSECTVETTSTVTINVNPCQCAADFDRSGGTPDPADIAAFFNSWLGGDVTADVDCSGGTPDITDISFFFSQWLAGGC
jgi:hypothetical protein